MARLKFRITTIHLDDEEDAYGITAVVRDDTFATILDLLGADAANVAVSDTARGGTELTVMLAAPQMLELFRQVGKVAGDDPRYATGTSDVYDSLSCVVYGLMEKD